MSTGPIPVGRDAEISQVRQFLEGVVTGSRSFLLEGEAGIGKSTILESAAGLAIDSGMQVLRARPVEAEMPLEFAALADVLGDIPHALIHDLPDPQRRALRAAVFRDSTVDSPVDARSIATATLNVLRSLAEDRPILLVIDDLPWLDLPSRAALSFAIRRAGNSRIGMLVAVRTEQGIAPQSSIIEDLDTGSLHRLVVGPLSLGAIRIVITEHTGRVFTRAQFLRVHESSGGNPMFAKALAEQPAFAVAGPIHDPITLPEALRETVLNRVTALSNSERDVLLVCALCSDSQLSIVVAAASDPESAPDALESLVRSGIVDVVHDRVVFTHPLMRSVAISEATPADRRRTHAQLAKAVERPEAKARHLGLAANGPDSAAATAVEEAALIAGARGACEIAADLAELAVALTGVGDWELMARRVALEAGYRFESSDPVRAHELLVPIVDRLDAGPARSGLLQRVGRYAAYHGGSFSEWQVTLEQALEEAGPDGVLQASILMDLATVAGNSGDLEASFGFAYRSLDLAQKHGDLALAGRLSAGMVWLAFMSGQGVPQELISLAANGAEQPAHLSMELRPNVPMAHSLHLAGDLDRARTLYEIEYSRASAEGVETGIPILVWGLVETEAFAGNWDRAEQVMMEGYRLAEESGSPVAVAFMKGAGALVHTLRGRLAEGSADALESIQLATNQGMLWYLPFSLQSIALGRLSVGDALGAHEQIAPYVGPILETGIVEPGALRFLPDEIEALIRLGRIAEATEVLDSYTARAIALQRDWAIAVAGRCEGLLLAAGGRFPDAEQALERALSIHHRIPFPFDEARTLLVAGEINRRARHKKQASEHLARALALFRRLGAPLWEARALEELGRIGMGAASDQAGTMLTPAEWRVAELVASGLSNARVAEKLFMGQRTVESHLSHIFRKLGVNSRTQMSSVVAALNRAAPTQ